MNPVSDSDESEPRAGAGHGRHDRSPLEAALFLRRLYLLVLPVLALLWLAAAVAGGVVAVYGMAIGSVIWLVGFGSIWRRIQRERGYRGSSHDRRMQ